MAQGKKSFLQNMEITRSDNGLDAIFPATPGTQATQAQKPDPTTTKDGRKNITFKLPAQTIEHIKRFSYWERVEQWQFVADAIDAAIKAHERNNGELQPIPKR